MKSIITTILFLSLGLWGITAQEMNMNQCIRYALEHNLSYTNKNIESSINEEQYRQSKRNFLPNVNGGSSANQRYGRSIDPTTNTFINQTFFSMNFYLDSQVDLFRGFTRVNTVKFQRLQYLISRENVRQKEMEIAFAVMNRYYDVLYFTNLHRIVREQVRLTTLNVEKTKKLIDLGLKAESDLLEMKAQEASEMHNLTLARNQRDLSILSLKNLMNYPADDALQLEEEITSFSIDTLLLAEVVYEAARRHMPSVLQADLNVKAFRKRLDIARGELFPRLSLGAGLYTNFADSRKERIYPDDPSNMAMRTVPFNDQWSQNMAKTVYVSLQIPIFNRWGGMSQIKQAKWQCQMAVNSRMEEEQNLRQLIHEDISQLKSLYKEETLLKAKKEALQEAYLIAEKKLEQGLINVIEFYTAKNQLAQAEADRTRTLLQLKVKEQTIRFYTGEKFY